MASLIARTVSNRPAEVVVADDAGVGEERNGERPPNALRRPVGARHPRRVNLRVGILLAAIERILGPKHPDTLTTHNNLALAYRDAGRIQDSKALLAERRPSDDP